MPLRFSRRDLEPGITDWEGGPVEPVVQVVCRRTHGRPSRIASGFLLANRRDVVFTARHVVAHDRGSEPHAVAIHAYEAHGHGATIAAHVVAYPFRIHDIDVAAVFLGGSLRVQAPIPRAGRPPDRFEGTLCGYRDRERFRRHEPSRHRMTIEVSGRFLVYPSGSRGLSGGPVLVGNRVVGIHRGKEPGFGPGHVATIADDDLLSRLRREAIA